MRGAEREGRSRSEASACPAQAPCRGRRQDLPRAPLPEQRQHRWARFLGLRKFVLSLLGGGWGADA